MMNKFTSHLSVVFFLVLTAKLLGQCPTVGADTTLNCGGTYRLTARASQFTYSVTNTACTPIAITGTNAFPTACDDCVTGQIPIGFNFNYYGNIYNSAIIQSNGIVGFGPFTFTGYSGLAIPSGGNPNNYIAGIFADIDIRFGGSITYATVGTAPNRRFVVSYNNVVPYNSGSAPAAGMTANFQIVLNESGTFNIIISQFSATWNASTSGVLATSGAENLDGTIATAISGRNNQDFRGITAGNQDCRFFGATTTHTFARWQEGTTTISTSNIFTVTPTATTTYNAVWNVVAGGTCTDAVVANVIGPVATISPSQQTICSGQSVTLSVSGATSYLWSTGATTASITPSPTSTTTYRVTGTSGGCTSIATATVTVNTMSITCPTNITVSECNPIATFATPTVSDVCVAGVTNNSLANILSSFNTNGASIASSIPSPFTFTLDGTGGNTGSDISDGGFDMYDSGNFINTNLATSIPYTGGVVTNNANFGVGGQYFTANVNNVFMLAADINNISSFSLSGNNGADGSGTAAGFSYTPTIGGQTYNVFVKTVCAATDPSINQVIILPTGGSPSQTFATNTDDGAHAVSGISSSTRLYYLLFAGTGGYCYTNAEIQNAVQSFLTGIGAVTAGSPPNATVTQTAGLASGSSFPVGTNVVTFRATSATGVTASCSFNVVVQARPSGAITGNTTICAGNTTTLSASGTGTYAWSTGATTQAINVSAAGAYRVTVTSALGCTNTGSVTVTVNPSPAASSTSANICAGQSGNITASGGGTYLWSTGAATATLTQSPASTTSYTVTVTSAAGCTALAFGTINVNPLPTPAITGTNTICNGQSTTLTASGGSTYVWNTGATTAAITVTPTSTTTYTSTATSAAGCTATASRTVTVNPLPTAASTNTTICAGQSGTITASGGGTYQWSTGATTASLTQSPASTTSYTVTVTSAAGCTASAIGTVTVNPLPTPAITGTNTICAGQTTVLTASGGTSYLWSSGQNTTGITVALFTTTNYIVTATNSNGCTATAQRTVTVNNCIENCSNGIDDDGDGAIDLADPDCRPLCSGTSGNLLVNPSFETPAFTTLGNHFLAWPLPGWIGTGNTPNVVLADGINPSGGGALAAQEGSQYLDIVGGSATFYQEFSYNCNVRVFFSGYFSTRSNTASTGRIDIFRVNTNGTTTLVASSNQLNMPAGNDNIWYLASGTTMLTSGTYRFLIDMGDYSNFDNACFSYDPFVATSTSTTICAGQNGTITASGGGTYQWSTGATTAALTQSPASTTSYVVTVVSGAGCTSTATGTINVNPVPAASSTNSSICAGQSGTLTASGGGTYLWSTGATTASITQSPASTTSYTVTVTNASGCTASAIGTITVNPLPAAAPTSTTICIGQSGTITASGGGTYLWSTGAVTAALTQSPASTTSYTVTVTSAAGCSATGSSTITVNPLPTPSVTGTNTICNGQSTTLTASGGSSYTWSTGANTAAVTVSPASTTTYTVTASSAAGCTATANRTVTVNPLPTAASTNTAICAGQSGTITASGGGTYLWSTGAVTAALTQSPASTTSYTVTVTSAAGCTASAIGTITVNPLPTPAITGTNTICNGQSTTLTASGGNTYVWNTGATTAAITVAPTSTTTYTSTATSAAGCTATASRTVTVNPLPTAASSNTTICAGQSGTITASGGGTYQWSTGAVTAALTQSPASTTSYTVTVTSAAGCTASAIGTITVNPLPVAASTSTTICAGQSGTITASGGGTYLWSTGAVTAALTQSPASTTSYTVTVTSAAGCTASAIGTITVNPLPTPSVAGTNTICNGQSTTLTASGGDTYVWNTGATTAAITVAPTSTTTYTSTATSAAGCTATASRTVTVNVTPTPSVVGTNTICIGQSTTLTASGGSSYIWNTGATTAAITVAPAATISYFVTVTNGSGCTATGTRTVTVNPLPTPSISGTNIICEGQSTTLNSTGGNSYLWNTGAVTSGITVSPISTTTYTVTATSPTGCTAVASRTVTVNPLPTPSIGGTNVICNGQSTTLTASGGSTYTWSTGATTAAITVSPVANTTYTVTATSAAGCTAVASRTVTVNALPTPSIGGTNVICNGQSTTLTATGGVSYVWSSGQNTAAITVAPVATTSYTATVTDANGCSATANRTVTVNALPTPSIGGTNVICVGESTTLTASGGTNYVWSSGQNTAAITIAPVTTTSYTATVTDANGCSATAARTVTVNPLPTPSIGGTNVICNGQSTTLTASGGSTYTWSTGATTAAVTVSPVANTTYTVTATSAAGCTAVASRTVTVNALPTPSITGTNVICNGQSTTLTASGGTGYVWSSGQNTAAITVAPAATTSYTATVTDANGCSATANRTVTVNALPTPSIGGTNVICVGQSTTLTASGGTSYVWSSGQNTAAITVAPTSTTTYTVTATNASGCTAVASRTVTVNALPTPSIGGTNVICNGQSTTLTASGGSTYTWSTGATTAAVTVSPVANTTYSVTATSAAGCTAVASRAVTVNALPTPSISGTNVICNGQSTTLTATGGASYIWSSGQNTAAVTVAPTTTTSYTATATDANGCTASATRTVTVNALPTPSITGTNVLCAGQSTTLTASGAVSYVWSSGQNTAAITVAPASTTGYTATATDANGCSATATRTVTVNALPTPSITGTNVICAGLSTALTASGGGTYLWSTGASTSSINVTPTATTTYLTTVTSAAGCTAVASRTVTVNALPILMISGTNPACVSTTLTVSGAANYIWSTGSITTSQAFPVPGLTSFVVSGTDANGCSSTISGVANVRSAATNAALASGTVNGIPLLESCTENGWTYYVAPSNPNEYLFAVEWGNTNNAARSAAIVSIDVNNALYGATTSAAASGQGIPIGTWVMPRSWNVNIGANTLATPVKVRFYYDQTEVNSAIQAAVNFTTLHGLNTQFIEPFIWFKTVGVAYQPNNFNSTTLNGNGVYVGQSIVLQSTQGVENGVTYAEFSNIQSFSGGTGATGVGRGNPLPITLEYFHGEKQGEKSLLTWRTQTEFNNSHFLLERSTNGVDFSVIGRVEGAGNSTTPLNYSFLDESPRPGNNYYRLLQVDFDGIEKTSGIVVLHFEKTFAVSTYPNPFEHSFTIDVVTTQEGEGLIEVFDMAGRLISSEKTNFAEGNNSKVIYAQEWAPGAYIIKVSTDGFTTQETLIKSKF